MSGYDKIRDDDLFYFRSAMAVNIPKQTNS